MTIFFDLDGCLVDSRQAIGSSVDRVLAELRLPVLAAAELVDIIGPPLLLGFRIVLAKRGSDADPARCVAAFRRTYAAVSLESTHLQPGIAPALDELRCHRLAIVTSKAAFLAEPIVRATGLSTWFDAVFAPDASALDEPKTVTLARALAATGGGDAMVGDRSHDVEAGLAHGLRTVGVTWGSGSRSELVDAGASVVIDRPGELSGALVAA